MGARLEQANHLACRIDARFVEDVFAEAPVDDLDAASLDRADVAEEVGEHVRQKRRLREFVPVKSDHEAAVGDRRVWVRKSLARRDLRKPEALVERERAQYVRRMHAHFVKASDHGRRSRMRRAKHSTCAAESLSAGMYSKSTPPAEMNVAAPRIAISSSVSRQSTANPGQATARRWTP